MENEKEKSKSTILRCFAFGDLRPADICALCEDCETNAKFSENGGCPGMLLTGSRENLAAAMNRDAPASIAFKDVVVVNAKRYQAMEDALKKIAAMEPETHEEPFSSMRDITVACGNCQDMIGLAREALEVMG